MFLSQHIDVSLPFSLPLFPSLYKINKILKKKRKKKRSLGTTSLARISVTPK